MVTGLAGSNAVLFVPGVESAAQSEQIRQVVVERPDVVVLGLPTGSALAFGGDGTLESWGEAQPTIALGNAYTSG
jgi:hypothetical protein